MVVSQSCSGFISPRPRSAGGRWCVPASLISQVMAWREVATFSSFWPCRPAAQTLAPSLDQAAKVAGGPARVA